MKKFLRLLRYGFLSWLVIFVVSVCLFFLKKEHERQFEALMGITLTLCTTALVVRYFRRIEAAFVREGALLGLAFLVYNLFFDTLMFVAGPMQMPLPDYLKNIGVAYLSMPVISLGMGWLLKQKTDYSPSPRPPS